MNHIAELGNEIHAVQLRLGLPNPLNLNSGLSNQEMLDSPLLNKVQKHCELHDLFEWRNGSKADVPMSQLWLVPGHYLVSAQDSVRTNHYLSDNSPDWQKSWFPLMESGAADIHFVDLRRIQEERVPVFYCDSEFSPGLWQIYDSVELMLRAILECYKQRAYFVGSKGYLQTNARLETEICGRLNPESDHWLRTDLYRMD